MLQILLLASLFAYSLSRADGPVRVEGPVSVPRGGAVDLRQVLSFRPDSLPAASRCRVTSLARSNKDCARVSPNIFDCRTYYGPISYQHLGCFAPLELATFMISTLPLNYSSTRSDFDPSRSNNLAQVYASSFAVEIHVEDAHAILRLITIKTVQADPVNQPGVLNMTIVFPSAMVGRSKYEVISKWDKFRLPLTGDLSGMLNQPTPSGYVPVSSLTYHPLSISTGKLQHSSIDFVLIRIYACWSPANKTFQSYYSLLGFRTNGSDGNLSKASGDVAELKREVLVVRQAANTPIFSGNFSWFNLTKRLAGTGSSPSTSRQGQSPTFHYTFPVLPAGSFQSLHTSIVNVSYTSFSDVELQAGHVAFHPTDILSSATPFIFPYNVTTRAGVLIATGEVSVLSSERDWSYPSQRTNKPLQVAEGGWAPITKGMFDLYLLKPCDEATTLRALSRPLHGQLVYSNGTQLRDERILFLAVAETSLLRYQHSGDEAVSDVIYWEVWCPSGPSLSMVTRIHISALDDYYPTLRLRSEATAYRGWPMLLSTAMLQPDDVDSPLDNITFSIAHHHGSLLNTSHDISQSCPDYYLPAITSHCLFNYSEEVDSFSVKDLELLRIWYNPSSETTVNVLELTVTDSLRQGPEIYSLYVVVTLQQPNQSLVISTSEDYPHVLRNRPLPLRRFERVFITPYFLFSQAPPLSSLHVRYVLETPPINGYLCDVTQGSSCSTSLEAFTQLQISQHEIVYQTKNHTAWTSDNFTFVLGIDGFFSSYNTTHVFNMTLHQPHVVTSDTPLVLDIGGIGALTPTHFKTFSDILQTTDLIFMILRVPQYGLISLQVLNETAETKSLDKRSSFTYADVTAGKLRYDSSQQRSEELCHDEMELEALAPFGMLHGRLPIVFKGQGASLSVAVQPRTLIGSKYFKLSAEDISVNSSFCSKWVVFYLQTSPSVGRLSIKDNAFNTEYELLAGSRFTAHDVQIGAVVYRVPASLLITQDTYDTFHFQVLDPSSGFHASLPLHDGSCGNSSKLCSNFTISLLPPPRAQDYILELYLTSQLPITWLPQHQSYGYTFSSADIVYFNTSLPLQGVLLQLEKNPTWGNVMVNKTFVSFFTMADFIAGRVAFLKNWLFQDDWHEEWLSLGVYAYLPSLLWQAQVIHLKMTWSVIEMEQSSIVVSENQGAIHLSIRRQGASWFQSRVTITTLPNTALAQSNCSHQVSPHTSDFCHTRLTVVFEVGVVLKTVSITLLDDHVAEGVESFYVTLVEEVGLMNAILSGKMQTEVFVTDYEDYNTVRILGDSGRDLDCDMEVVVKEDQGKLVIPLVRDGYINQELGVVCYTEDDTASAGEDYVPRPFSSPAAQVTFPVNSSTAECEVTIMNDQLYELREQFMVHLAPIPTQTYISMQEFASLCVFICYDEMDSPEVFFQPSPVLWQEDEQDRGEATFSLYRRGTDLNLTTTVKYNKVVRAGDTAVEGEDYLLYTSNSPDCSLEGDDSPGGCVQFAPSQKIATLTVIILPDAILEGDEVFHLRIIYVREGRKSKKFYHSTLAIIIKDATKPTYVEFVTREVILYENSSFHSIRLRRRGYLEDRTEVAYTMSGITATGGLFSDSDFFTTPQLQRVVFAKGQNESLCRIFVVPDMLFEGRESLNISLETVTDSPTKVVLTPNSSSIIVHILDPEDGPQVKFRDPSLPNSTVRVSLSVTEPLSNRTLDQSLLSVNLIRQGDTDYVSTVSISSRDGSARNGRDFIFQDHTVTFYRGVSSLSMTIPILANHRSNENLNFWLELTGTPDSTFDPLYFSYHDSVEVVILNKIVEGPFFLAPPQLDNREDWGRSYSGGQYYDLPLLCLSSCDDMYDTLDQQIHHGCQQQLINNSRTVYLWEVSVDEGVNFHVLNASSVFTSPDSRELQTLYLDPGMYVRCRVKAVDQEGQGVYWRTSETVLLNSTRYRCYSADLEKEKGEHIGFLTSYNSFGAFEQDMVQLEVLVPARPSSFPVVSIVPASSFLTPLHLDRGGPNISDSPCSTLNLVNGYSLLDYTVSSQDGSAHLIFRPLYEHLDRASCQWRFVAWLSVGSLVSHCGGQRITSKEGQQVSVLLASDHVSYVPSRGELLMGESTVTTVSLATLAGSGGDASVSPAHFLPPPILTRSRSQDTLPHVFPIAISDVPEDEALLKLLLFSGAPPKHLLLLGNHSYPDSELLYVDVEKGWQVWAILLDKQTPYITLEMVTWTTITCAACQPRTHLFSLPLGVEADGEVSVSLLLDAQIQVMEGSLEKMFHGNRVSVHVELSPLQQIQERGLMPHLQQAWLCQKVGVDTCSNRYSLMGVGQKSRYGVLVEFGYRSFNMSFSTSALTVVTFPSYWSLHISYNLSSSSAPHLSLPQSFSLLHGKVILPFTLHEVEVEPASPVSPSLSLTGVATGSTNLQAILIILATAVLVLVVCLVGVSVAACASQGKAKLQAKAALTMANLAELNKGLKPRRSSIPSQQVKERDKDSNQKHLPHLKRSNSTIGLPTLERHMNSKSGHHAKKRGEKPTGSGVRRCHSLPALLPISTLSYFYESPSFARRLNLNKVHTRIKRLAKLDYSELYSNSKKKLQGNKHITKDRPESKGKLKAHSKARTTDKGNDGGGVLHCVGGGLKCHGVNEAHSSRKEGVGVASYASFVVHSLATSARTPEPGSHPTSRV